MPQIGFVVEAPTEADFDDHDPFHDPIPEDHVRAINNAVASAITGSFNPTSPTADLNYYRYRSIDPGVDDEPLLSVDAFDDCEVLKSDVDPEMAAEMEFTSSVFNSPTRIHRLGNSDCSGNIQARRYLSVQNHQRLSAFKSLVETVQDELSEDESLQDILDGEIPVGVRQEMASRDIGYHARKLTTSVQGGCLVDLTGWHRGTLVRNENDLVDIIQHASEEQDVYLVDTYGKA